MFVKESPKKENLKNNANNSYDGCEGLVYARVSSKRQEAEGHGLQSQEARCIADLKSISVPYKKTFPDSYSGGGDFMNRPAMREMLDFIDAHAHKNYVVIFDDLSRFARDVEFHLKLRAAFKVRGVKLRCLNYNFDESPEGRYTETILAAGNELQRHQNRRQVIQKQKARLEIGYWPFAAKRGFNMDEDSTHGKISVPNRDAVLLKEAIEAFIVGSLQRKIDVCRFLVERKFWKKQLPEKYIDKLTVIFSDPFICGDIEYPAWEVARRQGRHEGIITRDQFALLQKRLKSDRATARVRIDIREDFPLRGLVLCSSCEKPMTAAITSKRNGEKHAYYYCQRKGCPLYGKMCRRADVERDFRLLIKRNRLKPEIEKVVDVVFGRVWGQEVKSLEWQEKLSEHRKSDLEEKMRQWSEMARKALSDRVRRTYETQIEDAAKEMEQIEEKPTLAEMDMSVPYRTALGKCTGLLKTPIAIWDSVDVHEKHRLFFFLFEAKLAYTKNEGYRTGDSLSTTRLFEEFVATNSQDVEMARIALASREGSTTILHNVVLLEI